MNIKNCNYKLSYEEAAEQVKTMVHKFVMETNVPGMDNDDIKQELDIVVYMAWEEYRPDAGAAFSTFAYRKLYNRKNELHRKAVAKKRGAGTQPVSIDAVKDQDNGDSGMAGVDTIEMPMESLQAQMEYKEMVALIDGLIAAENPKVRDIYLDIISGYTQQAVAARNGCSQSLVSYHRTNLQKKVYETLMRNGYEVPEAYAQVVKKKGKGKRTTSTWTCETVVCSI